MFLEIDDLPDILFQAAVFLGIYYFFYKKYIYSIFDPLFMYVFTLAFSSVLVNNVLLKNQPVYAYHFYWCHLFFFIGFFWAEKRNRRNKQEIHINNSPSSFTEFETLRLVIYILFVFLVLTNLFLAYTKGFALLSDNPSEAKVENFTEGFGLISRINKSVGVFVLTGLFFCLYTKFRYIDLALLLVAILLKSLSGTKSAFAEVTLAAALVGYHSLFRQNRKIASRLKLMVPLGILGILAVSFTVFVKESADNEQAVLKFVLRLLYGADSTLFFYQPINEQYFAKFHFWEFPYYFLNSILRLFRLVPGMEAHGNVMVLNIIQNQSAVFSGPNTPYYIEGQIYFGFYGAYVYSVIIGALLSLSRKLYFNREFHSAFAFVFIACVTSQASTLYVEASYAFTKVLELCFFVLPVYIFVNFYSYGRIRFRRLKFRGYYIKL